MPEHKSSDDKPSFVKMEEGVLAFWDRENIFQKTLEQTKDGKPFVFFEGPPTANGKPGIHHVLARAYKDVICRYKTMRGFFVERKAGWDTHGLPVELQVEKALKISGKPEIEKYGVEKFNAKCRESVWEYRKDWEALTKRIGFWLDLEHPYVTYENEYIESVWSIIKQIWDKGLLYRGHKVVPQCPRCGTALSSHEVALGYQEVVDTSVYVKFKVVGAENTYFLSWTTTPWTLPGNVALAVGAEITYVKVIEAGNTYILAKAVHERLFQKAKIVEEVPGSALVGLQYEPLYPIAALQTEKSHRVYAADFVNTEEGGGVVHTAVMYGEDDYRLGEAVGLPKHHTVDENGHFLPEVEQWAGQFVKDPKVEQGIIADLQKRELLYKEEPHKHSYPFCWRCDTPLLYYAKNSWFIKMTQLKAELIKNNEQINWVPKYIKHGRFGEWLNELKDWAFSRERYWGTPLPIWESGDGDRLCIGSIEELKSLAKNPAKVAADLDLHRPFVDDIVLVKDGKEYQRVKEVIDVWFDSGAMPFAQWHYPFANRQRIDGGTSFPAEYISEAIDQTRGWFYTLLAISTLLGRGAPYRNVICLGHILDSKGRKMSKSKGNVVAPMQVIDQYGVDALRWHLFTMNQPGDVKLFDEKNVEEVVKKQWLILWNVVSFWKMYAPPTAPATTDLRPEHVLDRWVLAKLNKLVGQVTRKLDAYAVTEAGRALAEFIGELSTWYIRRSRARFKQAGLDKDQALATLHYTLATVARLLAPFAPFLAESLYREVVRPGKSQPQSVHLAAWPRAEKRLDQPIVVEQMGIVQTCVELGHALRKEKQLKVRQPLAQFIVVGHELDAEYRAIIRDEMNVQEVVVAKAVPTGDEFASRKSGPVSISLDLTITDELRQLGIVREVVRHINAMRKDARLSIADHVTVYFEVTDPDLEGILLHYKKQICTDVIASSCLKGLPESVDLKKVLDVSGAKVIFGIKKL